MTDILMPRLSDSMEEGTILRWLKSDGGDVAVGEELVEIETDKATMVYEAEVAGTVTLLAAEGDSLAVGEVMARVGEVVSAPAPSVPEPTQARPATPAEPAEATAVVPYVPPPADPVPAANGSAAATSVRASPLARRLAVRHAVALDAVPGSGPNGRIVRADVLRAAGLPAEEAPARPLVPEAPALDSGPAAAPPAAPSPAPVPAGVGAKGIVTAQPLTRLQSLIARRMAETNATVPDFQVATDVDMGEAIALRARLKELAEDGPVPSFNDLVIRAAALALRDHPRANGAYADGAFLFHERINVGMAVAADEALVVPTVFDADRMSLGEIARETRRLAGRVRSGEVIPPELAGGTFTVTNLGMFGMTHISPVINGGQAAILGVGAMREVLARVDGEIVDRTLMTLTLTSDHRILYGADAARALGRIRELLESPLKLAL